MEAFDPDFEPTLTDPDHTPAAALLVQEWDMTENYKAAPSPLANVAKRLAGMDWTYRPTAPEFVVIAIDMEIKDQAHIERHLKTSVPKRLLSTLKSQAYCTSRNSPQHSLPPRPSGAFAPSNALPLGRTERQPAPA